MREMVVMNKINTELPLPEDRLLREWNDITFNCDWELNFLKGHLELSLVLNWSWLERRDLCPAHGDEFLKGASWAVRGAELILSKAGWLLIQWSRLWSWHLIGLDWGYVYDILGNVGFAHICMLPQNIPRLIDEDIILVIYIEKMWVLRNDANWIQCYWLCS